MQFVLVCKPNDDQTIKGCRRIGANVSEVHVKRDECALFVLADASQDCILSAGQPLIMDSECVVPSLA